MAQKHFHFQFQRRTSNEQMISGKGGIRQFPRGCLSPHPHSRDPPLSLSWSGAASASLSAFRASVSPSADRELLHPQVRESD